MTLVPITSLPRADLVVPEQRRGLWEWRRRRREERDLDRFAARLGWCWADTVEGAGLVHESVTAAGLPHTSTPPAVWVEEGPPLTLVVRMLPGQVIDDYRAQAHRLAEGMGVPMVRISSQRHGWIRVALLVRDPLFYLMPLPPRPAGTSAALPVLVGASEFGEPVTVDFTERTHLIVQGRTGSGKSRLSYAILQQLAAAPDAVIAGCDPSSVLLRPFRGTRHGRLQVLGADPSVHALLLDQLTDEMDARLARIPERVDALPLEHGPFLFVVLEEWLALLGLAGSDRKLRDRLVTAVRRLVAEGGKVNIRVIMLPQRAEANEVGGGLLRGQFAYRLTLPVDNVDAVRLLHPSVPAPDAEAHIRHAAPGVALYDAPGTPGGRLRTPWMPDYGAYWDAVTTLTAATEEYR